MDLSKLSDEELEAMASQTAPVARANGSAPHDLSKLSDADLEALAAKTAPAAPENPHDLIPFAKHTAQGLWDSAKGAASAVGNAVQHPVDTAKELGEWALMGGGPGGAGNGQALLGERALRATPVLGSGYDNARALADPNYLADTHAEDQRFSEQHPTLAKAQNLAGASAGGLAAAPLAANALVGGPALSAGALYAVDAYHRSRMAGNDYETALQDGRNVASLIGATHLGSEGIAAAGRAAAEPAKDAALWAAKKGAKGFLGVNEGSFDRRLANPEAIDNAPPVLDTTRDFMEHAQENRLQQSGESGDSYRMLAKEAPEDPSVILHPFQDSIDSLKQKGGIGAERKEAMNYLQSVGEDVLQDAEANGGHMTLDRGKSVVTLLNAKAKAMGKAGADAQVVQAYKSAAGKINDYLKATVPEYDEAMSKLSADTRALKGVTDNFKSPQGALNMMGRIQKGKAPFADDALKAYDARNGTGFRDQLADSYANNDFTRATPNGSRRAVTFGATGTAIGSAIGGSSGAIIGGALGTAAGTLADVYGGQAVKVAQDAGIKLNKLAGSPYAKQIMEAAQGGPKQVAVAHYTLSQRDPAYQQLQQSDDDNE